jgi:hypothetical protein
MNLRLGADDAAEGYVGMSDYVCLQPLADRWSDIVAGLQSAADALRAMPVADIVDAIGTVAGRWCDPAWPHRRDAIDRIVAATGLSPEVVGRSLDVELRNYRPDSLWATLRRELGDPRVLDGFVADPLLPGQTCATGPRVMLQILTGNVPGLPALAIIRALLVKSAVIAKVGSGEPTFAASFAASLAEIDPRLGDAVLVTYWGRSDTQVLAAAAEHVDCVTAYGGTETCAEVRRHVRSDQQFFEHGHKVSLGLVARGYLERVGAAEIARRIAQDASMFNQLACIAPQAYLIAAPAATVRHVGELTAAAMEDYCRSAPLGRLSIDDAMVLRLRRSAQAWRAATEDESGIWTSSGADWTVAVQSEFPTAAGTGNRFITLVPVETLSHGLAMIRPFGAFLQNVALGCSDDELLPISHQLARFGAARLCEPGRMSEPSLMWRHDGRMCLAELVRWCDIEMHAGLAVAPSRPDSADLAHSSRLNRGFT